MIHDEARTHWMLAQGRTATAKASKEAALNTIPPLCEAVETADQVIRDLMRALRSILDDCHPGTEAVFREPYEAILKSGIVWLANHSAEKNG